MSFFYRNNGVSISIDLHTFTIEDVEDLILKFKEGVEFFRELDPSYEELKIMCMKSLEDGLMYATFITSGHDHKCKVVIPVDAALFESLEYWLYSMKEDERHIEEAIKTYAETKKSRAIIPGKIVKKSKKIT